MAKNANSVDISVICVPQIALKTALLDELEQDKSIRNVYQQYGNRIFVPAERMKVISDCKKELEKLQHQKDQENSKQS
uniref:Uncharacterized protein n=1 Tax=Echinococcus canadensis TaxID=519352 RepID=A0A915F0W3_9CEST